MSIGFDRVLDDAVILTNVHVYGYLRKYEIRVFVLPLLTASFKLQLQSLILQ